jgi:hypothetical protein
VIIGAPKAGTTSLFEYIRVHPEIHLPKWKETNFFLDPTYQKGVDWYLDWVLTGAHEGATCGEASVRYMAGTPYVTSQDGGPAKADVEHAVEEVIPSRIKAALPDVKLIVLLRDPVKRCMSEYQMSVLWGTEHRSPDEAIEALLDPAQLTEARLRFAPDNCYVVQSEYGRILEPYFERFAREQVLVMFTEDLAKDPGEVVRRTFQFVGVDEEFVPPNLGVRYLESSLTPRVRAMDLPRLSRFLSGKPIVRSTWRKLPAGIRQRMWSVSYVLEKWNRASAPDKKHTEFSPELTARLRSHFEPDGHRLAGITGLEPPWLKAGMKPA